MSMKVADFCGQKADPRTYTKSRELVSNSLVGVEIEMENARRIDLTYWDATDDGSLRDNGVEYVFTAPQAGVDVIRALDELEVAIDKAPFTPTFGERTSVHVHVDVRDLTKDQLMSFILLYMVTEKPLFKYCGEERESSNFCPSFQHAQGQIRNINGIHRSNSVGPLHRAIHGIERYASCNIQSVNKFGSLEFRGHRGEYRKQPLLDWINILLSLKESAKRIDPTSIVHQVKRNGVDAFIESVFGKMAPKLMYRGIERDVHTGLKLANDTLYHHKFTGAMRRERDNPMVESFKEYLKAKKKDVPTKPTLRKRAPDVEPGMVFHVEAEMDTAVDPRDRPAPPRPDAERIEEVLRRARERMREMEAERMFIPDDEEQGPF